MQHPTEAGRRELKERVQLRERKDSRSLDYGIASLHEAIPALGMTV